MLDNHEGCQRSYEFKNNGGLFPITHDDDSLVGLGGDFAVNAFGEAGPAQIEFEIGTRHTGLAFWKTYVEQKHQTYRAYAVTSSLSTFRIRPTHARD